MMQTIVTFFSGLPKELATFLIAMLPVGELRASIPIALKVYHLPIWQAILFSIPGTLLPPLVVLLLLGPVSRFFSVRFGWIRRLLERIFTYTNQKHRHVFHTWGSVGLVILAALPIPVIGGAWTAALAAFVFGIRFRLALLYLFFGTCVAAAIITGVTLAGGELYHLLIG